MRRPLSLTQRLFARVMDFLSIKYMGHPIPFLREILRTHGFAGYRIITATVQQVYSKCVERYGIIEANVLIGTGALWNGCHFCPRSHLWIANLYYLRDTGKLFPLDDAEASQMQKLTDAEALELIAQKLSQGGFPDLARRVERQYHLKVGDQTGTTEDDPFLVAAIAAWDWMAECTIVVEEEDDVYPADPIARDRALCDRYLVARGRPRKTSR